ncbi:ATP-binding protein [Streptomyces cucumeris]|uniref:ATP-binding protein n=1 Tax=Streptomyces cucumeris TaxID=2962890 RepID=UPI0020C86333|nr:ATP-binding protein [Streptomyces sp. NEAU-Y11]MCP9211524.1 ATP-binding protein [Streptomyces sp. NEAU-Y11]
MATFFGWLGGWRQVWRRYVLPASKRLWDPVPGQSGPTSPSGLAQWPELRAAGAHAAADRLISDARSGSMSDVDFARIAHSWTMVRIGRMPLADFTDTVLRLGAAAWTHPSGARDLPRRTAAHDLMTGQVRIGTAVQEPGDTPAHGGFGLALSPAELGTSVLAIGPSRSGQTTQLVRPIIEALCLQALARTTTIIAVGTGTEPAVPDDAFDIVIRPGDPRSLHDFDIYGGTDDSQQAATILAEALVGDLPSTTGPMAHAVPRAATALAELLGPFQAAHHRFPHVSELHELLNGSQDAIDSLRNALEAAGQDSHLRVLDKRGRETDAGEMIRALLRDRVATLEPLLTPCTDAPPFLLGAALQEPQRIRIDLPASGFAKASDVTARLVLAQFNTYAATRPDQTAFAFLVLDVAAQAITPGSLRGVQRLRAAHAGVLLTLQLLDDIPESLHVPLLEAVGCLVCWPGLSPRDAQRINHKRPNPYLTSSIPSDLSLVSMPSDHGYMAAPLLTRLHG